MAPAPTLDADTLLDADKPLDAADTLRDPYPLVFGPVGTLQNVAVISSMQKTPVGGATVGVDWTAGPPNCCTVDDVASCAAAGDAIKSSA